MESKFKIKIQNIFHFFLPSNSVSVFFFWVCVCVCRNVVHFKNFRDENLTVQSLMMKIEDGS